MVRNLLLLILSTVLSALLFEAAARAIFPPPFRVTLAAHQPFDPALSGTEAKVRGNLSAQPNSLYVYTPTGKRLRPNTRAKIENHDTCGCDSEVVTNSLGFRGKEVGSKKNYRVLFLGDSITLADYVPEERSWVRQVERLSEEAQDPVETINAGVWAVGLANEIAILKEQGVKTQPDLVVLGFYLNDYEASPGLRLITLPPLLEKSRALSVLTRSLSPLQRRYEVSNNQFGEISELDFETWRKEVASIYPMPTGGKFTNPLEEWHVRVNESFGDWGSAYSPGVWKRLRLLFDELKRTTDAHGFSLAIIAFPVFEQVSSPLPFDYPQRQLALVAAELEVPLLDLLPTLRTAWKENPNERIFYDWCHHAPRGQDIVAAHVTQWILQLKAGLKP